MTHLKTRSTCYRQCPFARWSVPTGQASGKEGESPAVPRVDVAESTQALRVILVAVEDGEPDELVGAHLVARSADRESR